MAGNNDGGPAFPRASGTYEDSEGDQCYDRGEEGMSLRDWFAGQALAGAVATEYEDEYPDDVAGWCYIMADAMLEARQKKEDKK